MGKTIILLSLLAFVSAAFAERKPFENYESIVKRQMFGAPPPGFDPTKLPSEVSKADQRELSKEQEKLQSAIHFSLINVTPDDETAVGFTDNTDPKTPVHYYLKVGETRNGWLVKAADAETSSMTIAKDDIEVTLTIGGNSAKEAGATAKAGGASAVQPSARTRGPLGASLGSRRRLRAQQAQAEQEKAASEAAAREEERQAQAEAEKAQREAERAEQRQQLQAIQEELKRVREAKAAATEKGKDDASPGAEQENDAD